MKTMFTFAVLGAMAVGTIGCHASADVDGPDHKTTMSGSSSDSSYKKTTTMTPDGDKTVRTETKTQTNP